MPFEKSQIGARGENLAEKYLKKRGYQIIERNWQYKGRGEIDIIARDKDTLVFVEVRVRGPNSYQTPQESVTSEKLHVLKRTAQIYQKVQSKEKEPLRIDLVAVTYPNSITSPNIKLFKNITQGR
ncbi:MAG: YraN family protein [Patescibacteria group bacterium]|nr:YraN family protein [Patescibacteria group bacterium]